jgi:predicted nucleic-acid-binding Zn-ribbon protein
MKLVGKCPKCGSREIFIHDESIGQAIPHSLPISGISRAVVVDYICSTCGYLESYVNDSIVLVKITKAWKRMEMKHEM